MAGMYPDNETLELFGETISWPGVDENGKFTNGSFSDPAVRPSFIPAETINLILDNISGLLTALGKTPNNQNPAQLALAVNETLSLIRENDQKHDTDITWLINKLNATNGHKHTGAADNAPRISVTDLFYPVGWKYIQYPNDPTPAEAEMSGTWEIWNARAEQYGLSSQPLPAYTTYTPTANYAAGAYVMYHLEGDDYALFTAKAAITNAAVQLDPVLWDQFQPNIFVPRRRLQEWLDSDFEIGDRIDGGNYDGFYVCEINVLGGKFPSFAGGNRPPFVTGGTGMDAIREIWGEVKANSDTLSMIRTEIIGSGAFSVLNATSQAPSGSNTAVRGMAFTLQASNVVLTGSEVSVRTISEIIWRRVA